MGRQPAPPAAREYSNPTVRLAALLRHLQVAVLLLLLGAFSALFFSRPEAPIRAIYTELIVGLVVAMALALRLNVTGHHVASARLTILFLTVPPWYSLALDPNVFAGDFVPMTYVLCPVVLAAMFLRLTAVVVLAATQWLGLAAVALFGPDTGFNWASLLSLVLTINLLSTLYSVIMRDHMQSISDTVEQLHVTQAELRHESWHDALTGLYNRSYLDQALSREIARAERHGGCLGVVMLDVDHFKTVNDTWGHEAGDQALRRVAALISESSRAGDYVSRYGGDEFIVLLPDATQSATLAFAELVRARGRDALSKVDESTPALTLSAGVAVYPDHGTTPDAVLRASDHALYAAKRGGRDRVGQPTPV